MSLLMTFINHLNWSLCLLLSMLSSMDPLQRERATSSSCTWCGIDRGGVLFALTLITCISLTLTHSTSDQVVLPVLWLFRILRWNIFFFVMNHLHLKPILFKWMCTLGDNVSLSRREYSFYALCSSLIYNRFLSFTALYSLWKFQMSH